MLQQTTVEAVKAYFRTFVEKWPTVEALAAAAAEDVMKAWAGLGYYSRARNLKACADLVARRGGEFPNTEAGLKELPGIGAYTSAAIAAIAFDRPAAVVDGNVERVVTRLYSIGTPLSESKPEIRALVEKLAPHVSYLSVNVSSPNTPGLRDLQQASFLDEVLARSIEEKSHRQILERDVVENLIEASLQECRVDRA